MWGSRLPRINHFKSLVVFFLQLFIVVQVSGANQKKNAGSTINIPQLNAGTSCRYQKRGKTPANGWFGLA